MNFRQIDELIRLIISDISSFAPSPTRAGYNGQSLDDIPKIGIEHRTMWL